MSDSTDAVTTRARSGTAADRKTTITQTQAMTGAFGGGAIILIYLMNCLNAGHMLTPTLDEAAGILIVGGPFFHLLGRIVMYWTGRLLPKDANI